MKFKLLQVSVIIFVFFVSLLPLTTDNCKAEGNEIYVDEAYSGYSDGSADNPYSSIQEAIDAADNGDIIYVFGGVYEENIIVDKQVKIWGGIDEIETIIDNLLDIKYMVEIMADEVTIEGITFRDEANSMESPIGALLCLNSRNNKINGNKFNHSNTYGIYISSSSGDNLISGNLINDTKTGIWVDSSNTNDVAYNQIKNSTEHGILIESSSQNNRFYGNTINRASSSGIRITNSNINYIINNTFCKCQVNAIFSYNSISVEIKNNTFLYNSGDGIYLSSSFTEILNNTFCNNRRGITLLGDNNIIKDNILVNTTASGIYAETSSGSNRIYLNSFKNNSVSAYEKGNNDWYFGEQGNYWSDYDYIDLLPLNNTDGIGDRPYSKNNVLDNYPLGYFLKPPKKPSNPKPADFSTSVNLTVTLKVDVEDEDSNEISVYFYRGDDDTLINGITPNPVKRAISGESAEFTFKLGFKTVFAWYAVADDGVQQNKSDTFIFSSKETPPDNKPPVPKAGGPYYSEIGELLYFNSSGSYDEDGKISFYRWNFGDATSEILEENPVHKYLSQGKFNVTLTVIDDNGSSASANTNVYIGTQYNDAPVAKLSLIESAKTGEQILFDSSGTYDADGDSLDYLWEFGNGETSVMKNPTYSYSSPGVYIVTLTVSDYQYSDSASVAIEITTKKTSSGGTPGFELFILITALISTTIILKRKKN